jgi:hypothetical protein
MNALTAPISIERDGPAVSLARLRITQMALMGAAAADPQLVSDPGWQTCLAHVVRMVEDRMAAEHADANQLVLFPAAGQAQARRASA